MSRGPEGESNPPTGQRITGNPYGTPMRNPPPSPRLLGLALAASILVGVAPLAGQTIPSPYRFIESRHDAGLFVGGVQGDRGALRLGPGAGLMTGARYGIHATGPLTFEASTFLLVSDREVYTPDGAGGLRRLGTANSYVGSAQVLVRLTVTGSRTWHGLAPFLLAGGGLTGDFAGPSDLEADFRRGERYDFGPAMIVTLGAGTRWYVTDRLSFRLEGVFHLWRLTTPRSFVQSVTELGPVSDHEWPRTAGIVGGVHLGF